MDPIGDLSGALWLALPVAAAGALHGVVLRRGWAAGLARPLDAGRTWRGRRLLGDHKTWRGVLVYVGGAALGALAWRLVPAPARLGPLAAAPGALLGALLGLGFALGELPNSFLKRRVGVAPGARGTGLHVALDQVDSLVGCLLAVSVVWVPPLGVCVAVLAVGLALHAGFNGLFVLAGIKERVF